MMLDVKAAVRQIGTSTYCVTGCGDNRGMGKRTTLNGVDETVEPVPCAGEEEMVGILMMLATRTPERMPLSPFGWYRLQTEACSPGTRLQLKGDDGTG